MWLKNDGQSEEDLLQNRFTAYISVALQRRRKDYMLQERRQQQKEILTDNPVSDGNYEILDDVMSDLPLLMQLENVKLLHALRVLGEKERQVFFARVLDEKSFEELANTTGVSYKSVTSLYYRALRKIRDRMSGDNEF